MERGHNHSIARGSVPEAENVKEAFTVAAFSQKFDVDGGVAAPLLQRVQG